MIRFLLAVLAASLCINEPCFAQDGRFVPNPKWDPSSEGVDDNVLVFVGKKNFLKRGLHPSDFKIVHSNYYAARYEIEHVLNGDYAEPSIDFSVWQDSSLDLWGPRSPPSEYSLLFVSNQPYAEGVGPKVWRHTKARHYSVGRTTDGDWAVCGDPYKNSFKKTDTSFYKPEPLVFVADTGPEKSEKKYRDCKSGARVQDLFDFLKERDRIIDTPYDLTKKIIIP